GRLRSKLLRRQRRAALVGEAYIVATNKNCQQRRSLFFRFLVEIPTSSKMVSWLGPIVSGVLLPVTPVMPAITSAPGTTPSA
ncbi:hypothetical protein, partial [Mesorhizobium qingshengii]|uniref:hypothetical protein n=1 Tax=Mesorhizobium qingshengii TaxID=1165689 RepID=UPI001ABFB91E